MTVADRIEHRIDQIEGHKARCLSHLLTLRLLAGDDAEARSPWLAMAEVTRATDAVVAEAEAAAREAWVTTREGPSPGIFLSVRLNRLQAAAADAVAAAATGDFTYLRRHLRRFETLTSAIWAVQDVSR